MKPTTIALFIIAGITLTAFIDLKKSEAEPRFEDIGVVKQSILKPDDFKKTQKGSWMLLDGSQLGRQSELFELLNDAHDLNVLRTSDGNYFLPNALGKFIRSQNYLGNGSDPDSLRLAGSVQRDAFQGHHHNFGGEVLVLPDPNYDAFYLIASNDGSPKRIQTIREHEETDQTSLSTQNKQKEKTRKNNFDARNYIRNPISDKKNGAPRIATESRPVNISLYTYIKVGH